jgi:NADPH:quinone reductase-like Zn-dependent oxidoreductase
MAYKTMSYRRVVVAVVDGRRVLQVSTARQPSPGAGEVTVRMTAAGVSYGDVLARAGVLPGSGKSGYVPGFDVTGTVEKLGPSVAGLEVGQAVTGLLPHGGYAQIACVPADLLLPLPQGVSPTDAAAAALNYFVAYQMLHRVAKPRPGSRILAHGAGSGVGRALVELARRAGLEVFGTASRAKEEAAALGAIPIDYRSQDFVSVVRGAGGVDAAFDPIGGAHFLGSYRTLRRGGTLVGFGVSSAWSGGKARGPRAGLSLLGLLGSNLLPDGRHARFYTASRAIKHRESYRKDLATVLQLLARQEIHPKIAVVLPLRQANHAHDLVEQGAVSGKVVLVPDTTNQQSGGPNETPNEAGGKQTGRYGER